MDTFDSALTGKVALVTGASRGVGAATARRLAEAGADVIVNYRTKAKRADAVAEIVRALGRHALVVRADMTDGDDTAAMFETVRREFGRLDLLVLNASGGLERDAAPGYAMTLNLTSQVRALDLALPLIPEGGRVVFVTSHLAHFYGEKPVYPSYEPVAASKKAGEDALRARIPELSARGVSLVVVSGDVIEDTITAKLLDRQSPGLLASRRDQAGALPTTEDLAHAIVETVADPARETGSTVYVGSTEWEL